MFIKHGETLINLSACTSIYFWEATGSKEPYRVRFEFSRDNAKKHESYNVAFETEDLRAWFMSEIHSFLNENKAIFTPAPPPIEEVQEEKEAANA